MPRLTDIDADLELITPPTTGRKSVLRDYGLPILVILCATIVLYYPVHAFKFSIIDDSSTIFQNPYLETPNAQDIGYLWHHSYYALYMPVTYTLWGLLARIELLPHLTTVPPGGNNASYLNPAVFHVASVILHAATSALVFLILRRLRFGTWPSLAGAIFFVVHPVQVQSVAWITGMNNLTGGFLGFLAVLLYLIQVPELRESAQTSLLTRSSDRVMLVLATIAFAAALLAKPTATLTPLMVIVLEILALRRPTARWLPVMLFWCCLSVACAAMAWSTSKPVSGHIWSPIWGRPFVVGDALAFYLGKTACPVNLTLDYGRSPRVVLGNWWGYVTWILPAIMFAAVYKWRSARRDSAITRWCVTGLALFVAGLIPVLGLVPFYTQRVSTVCDRYLYSAMIGPTVAIAAILTYCPVTRRRMIGGCVGIYLIFLAVQTAVLLPAWRDMSTQTNEMLAHNPTSAMAHQNAGMILLEQGRMDLALPEFELAMKYDPEADNHAYFTGIALESLGRQAEAVAPLRAAFDLDPVVPRNWYELWNVLTFLNRYQEAAAVARRHLDGMPNDAMAEFTLGKTLVADHKEVQAIPYLQSAARMLPREGAIQFFLGAAYERVGKSNEALQAYRNALALDPGRPQIEQAIERVQKRDN